MATDSPQPITNERLRTPRAAAVAGILFAVLSGASMLLVQLSIPLDRPYRSEWLDERTGPVSLAVLLTPFAGIAFLWFMGVVRDQLGDREDRFFSTVFLGSGLLFLAGLFLWMTLIGAVMASSEAAVGDWSNSDSFTLGVALIEITGGIVTLRMAGVFMFSSGTIWLRTKVMPRWLVWLTYVLSLVLLFGGASVRPLRIVFPVWVLIVSVFVLRATEPLGHDRSPG